MCVTTGPTRIGEEWIGMRVLLIEDDSAIAQSIELTLKSESFNTPTSVKKVSISASFAITTSFCSTSTFPICRVWRFCGRCASPR
jgi:hypothetical protein